MQERQNRIDQYECIQLIGIGESATVKLATDTEGKKVVLKVFDCDRPPNIETIERMRLLRAQLLSLDHPNIVKTFDFIPEAVNRVSQF